jgi:hypothetical protein
MATRILSKAHLVRVVRVGATRVGLGGPPSRGEGGGAVVDVARIVGGCKGEGAVAASVVRGVRIQGRGCCCKLEDYGAVGMSGGKHRGGRAGWCGGAWVGFGRRGWAGTCVWI